MGTDPKDQTIRDLESAFWDTMKTKDAAGASRMTDDGCIVLGAQGVSAIDAKSMAGMVTSDSWELKHYEFDNQTIQVRFLTDDIALIAYTVNETIVTDGQTMALEANDGSVWVRRVDEWRCAMHVEALAGDPFGRDRKAR